MPFGHHNKLHKLIDVIIITICGVVAGADTYEQIENFGKKRKKWLSKFLELPHGIPSHDTFDRIFERINPQQFQDGFKKWIASVARQTKGQVVAIDGKTLRRSHDKSDNKKAIHMISAWASTNQIILGQLKTDEKSNEITAIPYLLKLLDLSGCIITIEGVFKKSVFNCFKTNYLFEKAKSIILPPSIFQLPIFDDDVVVDGL